MFRDEVQTKMHGFLNVLGAAVLAAEYKWDSGQTALMLEDESADSLSFTDEFFAWREWKIDVKRLRDRRKFVTSFGSCSFDEPREDLRALGLLLWNTGRGPVRAAGLEAAEAGGGENVRW